jgi:hypothetical protein
MWETGYGRREVYEDKGAVTGILTFKGLPRPDLLGSEAISFLAVGFKEINIAFE